MPGSTGDDVVAGELARAFRDGTIVARLPDEAVGSDGAARTVQEQARGHVDEAVAGWKVGATSAKAQAIMRASGPFFGPVFASRIWNDGVELPLPAGFRGFECEFALRLGADLPVRDGGYARAHLAIAIDAVVPVIELVATRQAIEGMGDARLAWADFGFNHGLVLGRPTMPPPLDALVDAVVVARIDDVEVARGTGAEVLGHPLEALAWLTRQGVPLAAGELVSTGTCTGLAALAAGQRAEAEFGAFGRVGFTAASASEPLLQP